MLVAAVGPRRREADRIAAALRGAGHRAAVDLSGARSPRQLAAYAAASGFSHVLELGAGAARWIGEDGGVRPVAAAALRRALAGSAPLALPANRRRD